VDADEVRLEEEDVVAMGVVILKLTFLIKSPTKVVLVGKVERLRTIEMNERPLTGVTDIVPVREMRSR
jgi:hypothetical protein